MKDAKQNVIDTLKGKKVLFLENDNVLENGLDNFEGILFGAGIDYKVFFNLSDMKLEDIISEINKRDAIVFQTQWVYPIAKTIREYMFSLKQKKIIVECYINDPSFYYRPKGQKHDVYIFSQLGEWDRMKFYKLSGKPYWGYKNHFNK